MLTMESRCPLTRIIPFGIQYQFVVAEPNRVNQRKASKACDFRFDRSKKASHSVKRRQLCAGLGLPQALPRGIPILHRPQSQIQEPFMPASALSSSDKTPKLRLAARA